MSEVDAEHSRIHGRPYSLTRLGPLAADHTVRVPQDRSLLIRTDVERSMLCVDAAQWEWRYKLPGRVPLTEPLGFVHDSLDGRSPGQRVLMVGDGEGRNAVWAAGRHHVDLVELSAAGCDLARAAAAAAGVQVAVHCADLVRWLELDDRRWDVICMTYVALPPRLESFVGQRIKRLLTAGGIFVGEFAERVLQPGAIERIAPFADVSISRSERGGLTRLHVIARA